MPMAPCAFGCQKLCLCVATTPRTKTDTDPPCSRSKKEGVTFMFINEIHNTGNIIGIMPGRENSMEPVVCV